MVVPLTRPSATTPSADATIELYRQMLIIRRTEEQLARAHQQGLVHGACHTYVGEEAIAVGVCAHLTKEDAVFSTHRGHGHALAKGVSPRVLAAELFGDERAALRVDEPEVGQRSADDLGAWSLDDRKKGVVHVDDLAVARPADDQA
jgi:TPP-dependent pyruvate/acetoin dehydrogenase alpha subunit